MSGQNRIISNRRRPSSTNTHAKRKVWLSYRPDTNIKTAEIKIAAKPHEIGKVSKFYNVLQ